MCLGAYRMKKNASFVKLFDSIASRQDFAVLVGKSNWLRLLNVIFYGLFLWMYVRGESGVQASIEVL